MAEGQNEVWVRCNGCGSGYRNHRVLFEKKKAYSEDEDDPGFYEYHQMIECMGCETVKYRRFTLSRYTDLFRYEDRPEDEHVFPNDELECGKRAVMDFGDEKACIPGDVWKMYEETVSCLNANARTLAGGGLRATVEAICRQQGITNGSLEKKIDELTARGLLTQSQGDLLHEERYIGNAALHEMATPSLHDIEDGLMIVEGLVNTIYVLPAKAERLKKQRENRKNK